MFYDLNDNPIASFSGSIEAAAIQIYEMKIECRAGRFLAGQVVDDLILEARVFGDIAWVDLETTRIDLTPFANTRQRFQIRLTAGAVAAITRLNFSLRIEP